MTHDVVIVGGGPNGLMLACELRLAGVEPVVLERLPERGDLTRAQALIGRVLEVFDHRGLFPRMSGGVPTPVPTPFLNFGGLPLDLRGLPDNPLYTLTIPQPQLERFLEERALELGVEIRRGHEFVDFVQDEDGVDIEVRTPAGDRSLRARYLVGCDGARSAVRKRAGIAFPDTGNQDIVARAADVVLPESVVGGRPDPTSILQQSSWLELPEVGRVPFGFNRTERGFFAIGSFLPGIHIVSTTEWGRSSVDANQPMTVAEMRESVRRVLGADLPMRAPDGAPDQYRLFRIIGDSRQAERYRLGRVLLAGDAAHVHAAVNAPGLNLGLQDAVNLAWKLAGCLHGWAPPGLLDTYYDERRPVGERVLMQTQAQVALMAPGADVTALRGVFTELLRSEDNLRYVTRLMAGADIRYEIDGPAHPLLGRWVPDLPLTGAGDATRVAELMHAARPVLLDLTRGAGLLAAATDWKDRVDLVSAECAAPPAPAAALLIRPDGYVAWATDSGDPDPGTRASLRDALSTWFGAAR